MLPDFTLASLGFRAIKPLRRSLAENYAFICAVLFAGLVVASDWLPSMNGFWKGHQAVTSLITGAVLILVAVTGLDRIIANREARRWRPLALMIVDQLKRSQWDVDISLTARTLSYCQRRYGGSELPGERHYFDVLVEALKDRQTWAPPGDEYPDLIEELGEDLEQSKDHLETWAPLLIANSQLAEIGAVAVARQTAGERVLRGLVLLDVAMRFEAAPMVILEKSIAVVIGLLAYRGAVEEFRDLAASYERTETGPRPVKNVRV